MVNISSFNKNKLLLNTIFVSSYYNYYTVNHDLVSIMYKWIIHGILQ